MNSADMILKRSFGFERFLTPWLFAKKRGIWGMNAFVMKLDAVIHRRRVIAFRTFVHFRASRLDDPVMSVDMMPVTVQIIGLLFRAPFALVRLFLVMRADVKLEITRVIEDLSTYGTRRPFIAMNYFHVFIQMRNTDEFPANSALLLRRWICVFVFEVIISRWFPDQDDFARFHGTHAAYIRANDVVGVVEMRGANTVETRDRMQFGFYDDVVTSGARESVIRDHILQDGVIAFLAKQFLQLFLFIRTVENAIVLSPAIFLVRQSAFLASHWRPMFALLLGR